MDEWTALAFHLESQGDYGRALAAFYKAVESDLESLEKWELLARGFRYIQFTNVDERWKQILIECLSKPLGNHQDLALASISLLKRMPQFSLEDPLLILLLEKVILADPQLEIFLTKTRRDLLEHYQSQDLSHSIPFVYALAKQCFLNEYIFVETAQERQQIEGLAKKWTWSGQEQDKFLLALLGCYVPLHTIDSARSISDSSDTAFQSLLTQQVVEPLAERTLLSKIPTVGIIRDEISKKVQAQYEANPYPRWTSLNRVESATQIVFDKHVDHPKILIAGCGTGQHAFNTARQFKNSHVVALDLSRSSLAYAMRKASELQCKEIEFIQADILELGSWKERFDLIECTGVLHHMADPIAGWRVLLSLLNPGGIMSIGLYSERARQDVVAARRLIAVRGFVPTLEGTRECRQYLLELPDGELAKQVTQTIDFYTASACRDLLFHVQEHRFTLPQIASIIQELGLEFLGFELRDPNVLRNYLERYPEDPHATSLKNWDEYEREHPQTFAGMYQFHLKSPSAVS